MSVRIMALVFDHYPVGGAERLLALALTDHADHDGGNVYPSVATLCRKTKLSRRAVQMLLANMQALGWLELVAPAAKAGSNGQREGKGRVFRINPKWIEDPAAFMASRGRTECAGAQDAPAQSATSRGRISRHPYKQGRNHQKAEEKKDSRCAFEREGARCEAEGIIGRGGGKRYCRQHDRELEP